MVKKVMLQCSMHQWMQDEEKTQHFAKRGYSFSQIVLSVPAKCHIVIPGCLFPATASVKALNAALVRHQKGGFLKIIKKISHK